MQRVAIVGGVRTPFVKAAGAFAKNNFLDLAIHVVDNLVDRLKLNPQHIDELIFSTVLLDPRMPNAARELVLRSRLPKTINAHFISNNCISGLVAINMIAEGIKSGRLKIGLAGGTESMSMPSLTINPKAEKFWIGLSRARSFAEKMKLLSSFKFKYLIPMPPSPKEPSTGLTMGQHMELTAQEMSIQRQIQDTIAFNSHQNAARAQKSGFLAQEISAFAGVEHDNLVRADTSLERLAKLKPVFDRSGQGTLTAGNSSALTDGASVVCLMSEDQAKAQNREILAFVEDVQYAALDPKDGLLMAPCIALPKLMHKNNLTVNDIDLFEIHEAFAAQVAANLEVWEKGWSKPYEIKPIGKIPFEKINQNGGSIAIGHPFAATGGRLILSLANALKQSGKKTGVISVCAAGGMAAAVLLRRD